MGDFNAVYSRSYTTAKHNYSKIIKQIIESFQLQDLLTHLKPEIKLFTYLHRHCRSRLDYIFVSKNMPFF